MHRARHAGLPALMTMLFVATVASASPAAPPRPEPAAAAAVSWPPSSLVVSEVQTGGVSASDEFVELANQGSAPVDLMGLEVVYATASGTTVTRKATWPASTIVEPGRRVLLVNGVGVYAATGDAVYTGGLAATGGAIVLRVVGGEPIDAVAWGDATNGFVEGTAAPAPSSGSSLERRPGGLAGNGTDTNDNATDWFVQGAPSPQNAASLPVPGANPTASPTPAGSPTPTPFATATPVATPTASPTAVATPPPPPTPTPVPTPTPPDPTPTPVGSPSPAPSPTPVASPTPTPLPTPTPTPTPTPIPTPTPATPIVDARMLAPDTSVTVEGILTTDLGALESGRGAFVQDVTGGVALYLDAAVVGSWPAGTHVRLTGVTSVRYEQMTIRVAEPSIVRGPFGALPAARIAPTGGATEDLEGLRLIVAGTTVGSASTLADGLGITIDDGSGPVRAVLGTAALAGRSIVSGTAVRVMGPLGQRDSTGTGTAGYRIHATLAGELEITTPEPTPTPTPVATPTPAASPSPVASPTPLASPTPAPTSTFAPTPTPVASPTPVVGYVDAATARQASVGSRVAVRAVVTAEVGRLGSAPLFAIGDASGGILVRLPDGAGRPARGSVVEIRGPLADPYGQLEIRPVVADLRIVGRAALPAPTAVPVPGLGEPLEGRLATVTGVVTEKPLKSGSSTVLTLEREGGAPVRVMSDDSSGLERADWQVGATYRLTGVVGQRASRKGAPDGYRLWLRDEADMARVAGPTATAGPSGSSGPSSPTAQTGQTLPIAAALGRDGAVTVSAVVTTSATLLDATGRRIVVQDASGAVEVLVPSGSTAPGIGTAIRVTGRMGRAYGAPRLQASALTVTGRGSVPAPLILRAAPSEAHEWRLVRVQGAVVDVAKLGDRWRAEVRVGSATVVVVGQAGAGIEHGTLGEGRSVTVTGIVRRPYPTATDQRFTILPRFPADLSIDGSGPRAAGAAATGRGGTSAGRSAATSPDASPLPGRDANLAELAGLVGQQVRVGGLVTELVPRGFVLDDGTAVGTIEVHDEAADLLDLVEPGDAVNATGVVETRGDDVVVVVRDPAGLALAGALLGPAATAAATDAPQRSGTPLVATTDAALGETPGIAPGVAGLGTLVAISAMSVAVTLARRWQARRQLAVRVAGRLARFTSPAEPSPAPTAGTLDDELVAPWPPPPDDTLEPRTAEHASRTSGSA